MTAVQIFLFIILQPTLLHVSASEVVWSSKTKPVVFGEDLELFCNTTRSDCNNCTKHWNGGQKDSLISFNERTVDPEKYVVTMNHKDGFGLTIKNLTEKDVHVTYSCSNGFDIFQKNLTLDDSYEYHPKNETTEVKVNVINGTVLHSVVTLKKVHPIPSCQAYFDEEDLSHKLEIINKRKVGLVYSVTIELRHEPRKQSGKFILNGTIGTKKTMFVERNLTFTYEEDQQTVDFNALYVLAVAVCIGVALFVTLYKYRAPICKKLEYAKGEKDEKAVTITITSGSIIRSDESETFLDSNGAEKDRKGYSV